MATPEDKVTHFNGRRASGVALLVIASLGCAWHVTKTREASDVVAWRLVGLPSVGGSYVVGDNYRLQPQKSNLPRWNFDTSVNYALAQSGARYFEGESLKLLQRYPELVQWSQTTLREVLLELLARRRGVAGQVRLGSLENRRFPGGLAPWRRVLDADHVMLTRFSEGYDADGTKLRASSTTGINWAIACVLRLEDGALVWCSVHHTAHTNLANRRGAQKAVNYLLDPMLALIPGTQPRTNEPAVAAQADAGADAADELD